MNHYLRPTAFIDSGHQDVIEFARHASGCGVTLTDQAKALYVAVRDEILYDPYAINLHPEELKASKVLKRGRGHCVSKALLMAAATRVIGIPSRLGFADVRNHLTTARLRNLIGTDVFYYHGYTELWLQGRWVKVTPVFNRTLCERFGVRELDFDGINDALFHPYDVAGQKHMEYVNDHGSRDDLPYGELLEVYRQHYPMAFTLNEAGQASSSLAGDFYAEAEREHRH